MSAASAVGKIFRSMLRPFSVFVSLPVVGCGFSGDLHGKVDFTMEEILWTQPPFECIKPW